MRIRTTNTISMSTYRRIPSVSRTLTRIAMRPWRMPITTCRTNTIAIVTRLRQSIRPRFHIIAQLPHVLGGLADIRFTESAAHGRGDLQEAGRSARCSAPSPLRVSCTSFERRCFGLSMKSTSPSAASSSASRCIRAGRWAASWAICGTVSGPSSARLRMKPNAPPPQLVISPVFWPTALILKKHWATSSISSAIDSALLSEIGPAAVRGAAPVGARPHRDSPFASGGSPASAYVHRSRSKLANRRIRKFALGPGARRAAR